MSAPWHSGESTFDLSRRLGRAHERWGVTEIRAAPDEDAWDALILLARVSGAGPAVRAVVGAGEPTGARRTLEYDVRRVLVPVDSLRALRACAGWLGTEGLDGGVRVTTLAAGRALASCLAEHAYAGVRWIELDLEAMAQTGDLAALDVARHLVAIARGLGRPVAVVGLRSPGRVSDIMATLHPDVWVTGRLAITLARAPDLGRSLAVALEHERRLDAWVAESGQTSLPRGVAPSEVTATDPDPLRAALEARRLFKCITGIANHDRGEVALLTATYAAAGADIIDVAARPDVVRAARQALLGARPSGGSLPALMVSVALDPDPHLEGMADDHHRAFVAPPGPADMLANMRACLAEGAEMVELHASDSPDDDVVAAVRALSGVLGDRYLSVCLGAEGRRPPRDVVRQARLVAGIHGPRTMIQAEGVTVRKDGSPTSTLQGLALAQVVLAQTTAYCIVAGGANYWTADLAHLLGVPIHGVASGSYARALIHGCGPAAATRLARGFVARVHREDGRDG